VSAHPKKLPWEIRRLEGVLKAGVLKKLSLAGIGNEKRDGLKVLSFDRSGFKMFPL
jgi:hypothetical protein